MPTTNGSTSNLPNHQDRLGDVLFVLRYASKSSLTILKYGLYGAISGWVTCYLFQEAVEKFAEENHSVIDESGNYVAEDKKFLHFSRTSEFNRATPSITEALPYYTALVGATAGTLFATNSVVSQYSAQLNEDRITRRLNIV